MKAIVLHEYGAPQTLKYEDVPDPKPGPNEVLVRTAATSVNPIDYKRRSGAASEYNPVKFPEILGHDVSGLIVELGEGVTDFAVGDRVMALTAHTYAEQVIVKASDLARVPEGLDLTIAASLPLVVATGSQLIRNAAAVKNGQTVLITGALGSVGRIAVYTALQLGSKVIAGVRTHSLGDARALGVSDVIAIDDESALARLEPVDAVADTVGDPTASVLLSKVKPGGNFGSLLGPPQGTALHSAVHVNAMGAVPDPRTLEEYAAAVRDGKLKLPIDRILTLEQASDAHAAAEKGARGKVVMTA